MAAAQVVISNTCSLCQLNLDILDEDDLYTIPMDNCRHIFCIICLATLVETCSVPVLRCHLATASGEKCAGYLDCTVLESVLTENAFKEYVARMEEFEDKSRKKFSELPLESAIADLNLSGSDELERETNENVSSPNDEVLSKRARRRSFFLSFSKRLFIRHAKEIPKSAANEPKTEGMKTEVPMLSNEDRQDGWFHLDALIKGLQNSGLTFDEAERQVDLASVIPTAYETECSICLGASPNGEGIVIKTCLHIFCRECLENHVQHSNEDVEVRCPFRSADLSYSCDAVLKPKELAELSSEQVYKHHYENVSIKKISTAANMFHCLTPNCQYFVEINQNSTILTCPLCQRESCAKCKISHHGLSCVGYARKLEDDERRLREMREAEERRRREGIERENQRIADERNRLQQEQNERLGAQEIQRGLQTGTYKRCPRCQITIEKDLGCDHMTCKGCRYEFYWSTLLPYRRRLMRLF